MAYGDPTLDAIMESLRASEGAPRPRFPITQTSSVLPNAAVAPAAPAAPVVPMSRAERFGRGAARFVRGWPGKFLGAAAAGNVLAQGLLGEPSVPNAIRTGVGLGAVVNPAVGVPLATGMTIGGGLVDLASGPLLRAGDAANDIRGPATKAFLARGGMQPPSVVAAPGDVGRDDTLVDATAGVLPPPEVLASPNNNVVPPRGTGFIRNNTTGAVTNIDSRASPEFLAANAPASTRAPQGFTEALLNLKQITGDNALKVTQSKAAAADLAARGTAARGAAALQTSDLSARLAAAHLQANPGDIAGASAILHGRSQGGTAPFRESTTTLPDVKTGAITTIDARTGKAQRVIPTPPVPTEADIQATMKSNKMSREQVIARLKQEGRM